ncbi:trigger factor [Rickettsiales bacterium LUAb2]
MDIKQVKSDGLKRTFNVIFSVPDIEAKEKEQLAAIAKKADIKGFRKGKAPLDVIEKNYKQSVLVRTFEALTKDCLTSIYKEHKISPITEPSVSIKKGDIVNKEAIEIEIEFETYPSLPKIDLASINLEKVNLTMEESNINEFLTELSKHYREFKDITEDRSSKEKDIVVIDFLGKIDDVAFQGGEAKNYPLELGSKTFIPGFEEQLLNKKAGEKVEVKVPFPEDYQNKELAGKDAIFEVEVKKIQEGVDCKFEDIPAKIGIKDLDVLKNDITERHLKQYNMIIRNEMKNELIEELINKVNFELPASLLQREEEIINKNYEDYKQHKDSCSDNSHNHANALYDNKTESEILAENKKQAEKRIKLSLIFNEIADSNNIHILPEEVDQSIQQEAAKYKGQEAMVVNYYKNNQVAINQLRNRILEDKILDFIFSQVKVNEKNMTVTDYNKLLENKSQQA